MLSNERGTDIISQNKEGVFSILGKVYGSEYKFKSDGWIQMYLSWKLILDSETCFTLNAWKGYNMSGTNSITYESWLSQTFLEFEILFER